MRLSLRERLLEKTQPEPNSGCLLWLAKVSRDGYGVMKVSGHYVGAHRIAWRLEFGTTNGLCVLHKCDTRCCVNVDHLFLGTQKTNTQDCIVKGRFGYNTLTKPGISLIQLLYAAGITVQKIAAAVDLSEGTVRRAIRQFC